MTNRTKEDWIEIGEATKKVFYELNHVYTLLQIRLGESNKEVKKVGKACTLISQARRNLEDQMFYENPNLDCHWFELFYGTDNFVPDDDYGQIGSQPTGFQKHRGGRRC